MPIKGINCTVVELKLLSGQDIAVQQDSINCTVVELKRKTGSFLTPL
ncbi:hypothetical protein HMPREF1532_03185 [Bacteroides salyersiae WAL 10018 = DSM 18765 = JCM 12988]|nr:hypothetical protein HMPREF1532_03185 [Bacteroides salyersiae WAL 10018 = DSM 18765 = JCM 12988]